ncbi:unnamed protein product [Blepharisma stoltei]|uniref:Protein kinase domain-containing protein n=1 Tax=Blepharisma stoltei TaxID=1481888 RepID=A0AAU9JCZ9_9CILI|nr:unnamed protein product [Blepharisma stoltei]
MNNYHFYEEIGRGKYSVVYKGRIKKTITYIAVKSVEKSRRSKVLNEVRIMHELDHENILKFFQWYETRNHLWLMFEYCPGGDLLSLIDKDKQLPEATVRQLGSDLRDALYYLHTHGIIFADLKPSNILFNEYGVVKLSDFGLARKINDVDPDKEGRRGTPYYMAPELFEEGGVYSYYSDLWSLGCVLYELAVGNPPFMSNSFQDLVSQILTKETPEVNKCSHEFNDLLGDLLQKDPAKRITWEELLVHPFWQQRGNQLEVVLPEHSMYEEYLKRRGVQQRMPTVAPSPTALDHSVDIMRISQTIQRNILRESQKGSYKNKEKLENGDFMLQSKDQVLEFGEKAQSQGTENAENMESKEEDLRVFHQRSNSAAQPNTPAIKNQFKPLPIDQLLIHNTDYSVKPIIESRDSSTVVDVSTSIESIEPWTPEEATQKVDSSELENHLSEVYSQLSNNINSKSKLSLLGYLESLITSSPMANKLINSAFVSLLLKLLRLKSSEIKAKICSVFGQLLRHATLIESELAQSGLAQSLAEQLRDPKENTRRKAIAALGEYLFYAATQMDEEDSDPVWDINSSLISVLIKLLKPNEDETMKYYATRTIENITAQSKRAGLMLAIPEVAIAMATGYSQSRSELLKNSAAANLCHLVRLNQKLFREIYERVLPSKQFLAGLSDGEGMVQQAFLTIVCMSLQNKEVIFSDEQLIPILVGLLENTGIVIRGKALLAIMFIVKHSAENLLTLGKTRFYQFLDRLARDSYKYVQCCLHHLLDSIAESSMNIIKMALESNFSWFPALLPIFNSTSARFKLPYPSLIKSLSNLLSLDLGNMNAAVIELTESLSTHSKALQTYSESVLTTLLPTLLSILDRSTDTRFRSLKIFSDIIMPYLFEDDIYDPTNLNKYSTKLMNELLVNQLMPLYGHLLEDDDPIPLYSLKLLSAIVERCGAYIGMIKSQGLISNLITHFEPGDAKLNIHLMQIIKKVIDSKEITLDELLGYEIIGRLNSVMPYILAQDWCIETAIDILYELLFLIASNSRDKSNPPPQTYPLLDNLGICTNFLRSQDPAISEKSAHCLLLILQLFSKQIAKHCTADQAQSVMDILVFEKPSLQKRALKVVKQLTENGCIIHGLQTVIEKLKEHDDAEVAEYAQDVYNSLCGN